MGPDETLAMKGVMLAERPGWALPGPPPFVPACSIAEPWGLNPTTKQSARCLQTTIKMPATRVHKHWIKALDENYKAQRSQEQESTLERSRHKQTVAAFSCKLRTAVLHGDDISFWKPVQATASTSHRTSTGGVQAPQQSGSADHVLEVVAGAHSDLSAGSGAQTVSQLQQTSSASEAARTNAGAAQLPTCPIDSAVQAVPSGQHVQAASASGRRPRPAWSLTNEAAEAAAAATEAQLVEFAQALDYEGFMASLEDQQLRNALQELDQQEQAAQAAGSTGPNEDSWRTNFIQALNYVTKRLPRRMEQQGQPEGGGTHNDAATEISRLSRSTCHSFVDVAAPYCAAVKGWDATSSAGKDMAATVLQQSSMAQAQECLRENPDLRHLHSAASIRAQLAGGTKDAAIDMGDV